MIGELTLNSKKITGSLDINEKKITGSFIQGRKGGFNYLFNFLLAAGQNIKFNYKLPFKLK